MANIAQLSQGIFQSSSIAGGLDIAGAGANFMRAMETVVRDFADPARDYHDPITGITIPASEKYTDKLIQTQFLISNSQSRLEFVLGMIMNFAQVETNLDKDAAKLLQ